MQEKKGNIEALLVEPFLVFYLVHSMQAGVGVLGFTRYIADAAGYQGWIAVIISGLCIHLFIWMIYKILGPKQHDIITVHKQTFGRIFGGLLSLFIVAYFTLAAIVVLRTYIEIVQIWIFPDIPIWAICFILTLLAYYMVTQGFRVVVGISFFSLIIPFFLLLAALAPLEFANFHRLLPLFDTTIKEQIEATKTMTLSYLGPEILLLAFPFIKNGVKSQKWAYFGNLYTLLIYLMITIVHYSFYSLGHIGTIIWPLISSWKIVQLPFIERFEYLGIAAWLIIITPNIALCIWAASRGLKEVFNWPHRQMLRLIALAVLFIALIFQSRQDIDQLNTFMSNLGLYFLYLYIPILFLITTIKRKLFK
ncbi:spore germination protein GerB [Alkalihalobacillus alcalophilus ATCC 27647 = CGMCC 1.3604]|uniref:Spore germination protein GerB n=1 Tax=Alkalihalobacillus alcalophilus ATCC 27647 = CGMCC 1.3604 TaxID=1218173 RepID=J8TG95_ALKAL|nr:GerAB/ArcD/ProY family transporter [Alkalihalobacillus alcalophilus]AFV25919.1 spore germination protein transporter [Alkalihalobacillus alcalophilus ATCC 27647 = CGMCC 1.3604]MED1561201.1 GerAB/ArcD/ProY family transporter [Alkalihalobacillus alcalophilus]THG88870.1 spore germination protein GerB [Alkalihalobacillus alcalophilus ATCC 27647 = CGMCC 1.3604]